MLRTVHETHDLRHQDISFSNLENTFALTIESTHITSTDVCQGYSGPAQEHHLSVIWLEDLRKGFQVFEWLVFECRGRTSPRDMYLHCDITRATGSRRNVKYCTCLCNGIQYTQSLCPHIRSPPLVFHAHQVLETHTGSRSIVASADSRQLSANWSAGPFTPLRSL